jgi:hypothetical protein
LKVLSDLEAKIQLHETNIEDMASEDSVFVENVLREARALTVKAQQNGSVGMIRRSRSWGDYGGCTVRNVYTSQMRDVLANRRRNFAGASRVNS